MLNYEKGMLVKSLAGHDAGTVYVIIEKRDGFLFLADGRLRTMDRAKKKKEKHVQLVKKKLGTEELTDRNIRAFIKKYQTENM